jgi:hypothetical protein
VSKVLLELINFDGVSLRSRPAGELKGGKTGAVGGLVGMTMGDACGMWRNALLVGTSSDVGTGGGFACNPARMIQAHERLCFIAETSMPTPFYRPVTQAELDACGKGGALPRHGGSQINTGGSTTKMLICGWRVRWGSQGRNLQDRIDDLGDSLSPGPASVYFLNQLDPDEFAGIIQEKCGFERIFGDEPYAWQTNWPGVTLIHICGDAADSRVLEPLVMRHDFNSCIVMGTVANQKLSSHYRDMRVLSIMLLLRHLKTMKPDAPPMHVISENAKDETTKLALAPRNTGDDEGFDPDFINTQAIIARCLVSDAPRSSSLVRLRCAVLLMCRIRFKVT